MPAVTADTVTLPRIDPPAATSPARTVRSVTTAPRGFEGEGFPVRRAFAGVPTTELDPFVHMDQMGEVEYGVGEPKGTAWHPHRGFETFTYLMDGTFIHQDSHGGGGVIENGGTQYMTAGSGILHIETPPESLVRSGGLFHGVQLWINLPAARKWLAPAYQGLAGTDVALVTSADGGALVRVLAGTVAGHTGPGRSQSRSGSCMPPSPRAPSWTCPGGRTSTPWSTRSPVQAALAPRAVRWLVGSWRSWVLATTSPLLRLPASRSPHRRWRSSSWVASPCGSRSSSTGRSS